MLEESFEARRRGAAIRAESDAHSGVQHFGEILGGDFKIPAVQRKIGKLRLLVLDLVLANSIRFGSKTG